MKFLKPIKKGFLQSFSEKRRRRNNRKPEADAPGLFSLLLTAFPRLLVSFPPPLKRAYRAFYDSFRLSSRFSRSNRSTRSLVAFTSAFSALIASTAIR